MPAVKSNLIGRNTEDIVHGKGHALNKETNMNHLFSQHSRRAVPLPGREKLVTALVCATLLWTTWALGGVYLWAQFGSLLLGGASLVAAIWPQRERGWANLRSLRRFPPFWLGLFVMLYMFVQYLNPSWVFEPNAEGRLVAHSRDFVAWLPNGIKTPFGMMGPVLMTMVLAPGWMLMCAVWAALGRPKAMRIILWCLTLNASLFATIGITQSITHARKMLWFFDGPLGDSVFWGTIANPNHSSAFMNMGLTASLLLLLHYTGPHSRSKDLSKGGSFLMLIPLSVIILGGGVQAMSRAGFIVAAIIVLAAALMFVARFVRAMLDSGNRSTALAVCGVLFAGAAISGVAVSGSVDMERLSRELRSLGTLAESPMDDTRVTLNKASTDLFMQKPVLGWGGGCYRYFINLTQRNYPQLNALRGKRNIVFAHNDYLNYLCELGLVGAVPLGLCVFGLPASILLFRRRGIDSAVLVGMSGIGAVLLHVSVEFLMQHPLVIMQFSLLLVCTCRMANQKHHATLHVERELAKAQKRIA